jgi:hypothetical protein
MVLNGRASEVVLKLEKEMKNRELLTSSPKCQGMREGLRAGELYGERRLAARALDDGMAGPSVHYSDKMAQPSVPRDGHARAYDECEAPPGTVLTRWGGRFRTRGRR